MEMIKGVIAGVIILFFTLVGANVVYELVKHIVGVE